MSHTLKNGIYVTSYEIQWQYTYFERSEHQRSPITLQTKRRGQPQKSAPLAVPCNFLKNDQNLSVFSPRQLLIDPPHVESRQVKINEFLAFKKRSQPETVIIVLGVILLLSHKRTKNIVLLSNGGGEVIILFCFKIEAGVSLSTLS